MQQHAVAGLFESCLHYAAALDTSIDAADAQPQHAQVRRWSHKAAAPLVEPAPPQQPNRN